MTSLLNEMQAALANPAMRHAMLVHMPIAMAVLGIPIVLATTLAGRRKWPFAFAGAWYLATALGCMFAVRSGRAAEPALAPELPGEVFARLELHVSIGERLWIVALGVAGCLAIAMWRSSVARLGGQIVGLALAIVLGGLVAVTAHHGGQMVYVHGAGVDRAALLDVRTPTPVGAETMSSDPRVAVHRMEVRPLLEAFCLGCHNPNRHEGDLDLTSIAAMLRGGASGEATIVPGSPQESVLIAVLRGTHPTLRMMPPDGPLDESEIAVFERWISEGAVWTD